MKKRIIKNDYYTAEYSTKKNDDKEIISVKANSKLLHPLTCNWVDTTIDKIDLCLTKYNYENNNFNFVKYNKICKTNSKYKDFLFVPPVGITSDIILKLYDINSIDSLDYWLNDNLETNNIFTINRILNCWITNNLIILKNHNKLINS